jgi:hypothetical protein
VPRRLTAQTISDLSRYVRARYALGSSFDQLAGHLSDNDRAIARQQVVALAEQLHSTLSNTLLQAYGVFTPDEAVVDTSHGGADMFVSLEPSLTLRVPAGSNLRQALDGLLDQMLSWEFPAHPHFPSEVRRPDLVKVHAQVRRAIDQPEHRIMVEAGERPVMRKVANPLRLGEQHEQYFVLGHHWENHLGRKIADVTGRGEPVKVGALRAWLDEPQAMGLPQEIADLAILVFAEQTNRSIFDGPRRIDVSALQLLPADARVVEQELPDAEEWEQARGRAQAIFGIGDVGELRTARNLSLLAERVRMAAASRAVAARELSDLLLGKGQAVLGMDADPAGTSRARTAVGAARLCEELAGTADDKNLVSLLAGFDLTAVALHVGKSLAMAADIVHAAERMDWGIYLSVAEWPAGQPLAARARGIVDQLARAWATNEVATALRPVLVSSDQAARQLLLDANLASRVAGPTDGPTHGTGSDGTAVRTDPVNVPETGDQVVDAQNVGEVTGILTALAGQGKRVHVTWSVSP